MPSRINNAKYWRGCAEETRTIADQIVHAESKTILMRIAQGYAELARLAEARKAGKTSQPES